jgi:hypothetical protein
MLTCLKSFSETFFCSPLCRATHEERESKKKKSDNPVTAATSMPIVNSRVEYSKALLFRGLSRLAFCDALRAGNGEAIRDLRRIFMLNMWHDGHTVYLPLDHHYLIGIWQKKNCLFLVGDVKKMASSFRLLFICSSFNPNVLIF